MPTAPEKLIVLETDFPNPSRRRMMTGQPEIGWQRGATIAKRDGPGTGRVELSPVLRVGIARADFGGAEYGIDS